MGQNSPKNANDHEQRARVHPALPSHSVVVPAPELSSINVAVECKIGSVPAIRKGLACGYFRAQSGACEPCDRSACSPSPYFAASLCLMKAVTMSFWASAMALLAVVIWSLASTFGYCSKR